MSNLRYNSVYIYKFVIFFKTFFYIQSGVFCWCCTCRVMTQFQPRFPILRPKRFAALACLVFCIHCKDLLWYSAPSYPQMTDAFIQFFNLEKGFTLHFQSLGSFFKVLSMHWKNQTSRLSLIWLRTTLQPDDWDEDDDGIWRAPKIPNPAYKGPWKAKVISCIHHTIEILKCVSNFD